MSTQKSFGEHRVFGGRQIDHAVGTAGHAAVAALAPTALRGSAFGLLATVQSLGNFAASAIAGLLWTAVSPTAAFTDITAWTVLAVFGIGINSRPRTPEQTPTT